MGKLADAAQKAGATLSFPCTVTFPTGSSQTFDTEENAEAAIKGNVEYRRGGFYVDIPNRGVVEGPRPIKDPTSDTATDEDSE